MNKKNKLPTGYTRGHDSLDKQLGGVATSDGGELEGTQEDTHNVDAAIDRQLEIREAPVDLSVQEWMTWIEGGCPR